MEQCLLRDELFYRGLTALVLKALILQKFSTKEERADLVGLKLLSWAYYELEERSKSVLAGASHKWASSFECIPREFISGHKKKTELGK